MPKKGGNQHRNEEGMALPDITVNRSSKVIKGV